MPYIYKDSGGSQDYILPSFAINTDTMELIATQMENDPITFSTNNDYELVMEV